MVTLIFGAGASFGSGNCYPTNPPLGNDLFNELVKLDGAFSRLDKKMKNEFKKKGFRKTPNPLFCNLCQIVGQQN